VSSRSTRLLRSRDGSGSRVTFIELFFDLVYVFAVTQLSTHLSHHLTLGGAFETLLLLVAVWWAWIDTAWVTNWFDPDHLAVRILLLAVMLASLVMSAALPAAFSDRGLVFAAAYAAIQVGRVLFVVIALGGQELGRNFQRILAWRALAGVLWLAGGLGHGTVRVGFWMAAVGVDVAAAAVGFATPGLGRSRTTEWTIEGGHLAERCQLFILIALGESILAIGATLAGLSLSLAAAAAFVVTFIGSVALWWIYFDRNAERAGQAIAAAPDPGRLGRSAYTYFHLPMVGGIIVTAVAAEVTIAEPFQHGAAGTTLAVLGGPGLFLAGHALFKRAVWGRLSWPRIIAMVALACLLPAAALVPVLALELAAVLIIGAVAAWETYARPPLAGVSAPVT
jgi:low temperature requirement protein LtrA